MKTLEMTEAVAPLAEYARDVEEEPIILTDDGKPVAALIAIENADYETAILSIHPKFIELIERSRTRYKKEGGISS